MAEENCGGYRQTARKAWGFRDTRLEFVRRAIDMENKKNVPRKPESSFKQIGVVGFSFAEGKKRRYDGKAMIRLAPPITPHVETISYSLLQSFIYSPPQRNPLATIHQ
jgi:hypothetical protein